MIADMQFCRQLTLMHVYLLSMLHNEYGSAEVPQVRPDYGIAVTIAWDSRGLVCTPDPSWATSISAALTSGSVMTSNRSRNTTVICRLCNTGGPAWIHKLATLPFRLPPWYISHRSRPRWVPAFTRLKPRRANVRSEASWARKFEPRLGLGIANHLHNPFIIQGRLIKNKRAVWLSRQLLIDIGPGLSRAKAYRRLWYMG